MGKTWRQRTGKRRLYIKGATSETYRLEGIWDSAWVSLYRFNLLQKGMRTNEVLLQTSKDEEDENKFGKARNRLRFFALSK